MRRLLRGTIISTILLSAVVLAPKATAACHAFTAAASPGSVAEGGKATIKIERDAAVNPSSVRVSTVNGSAVAPADYSAFDQRVFFTGDETEKTVTIMTKQDSRDESDERFSVKVSEGEGCQINQDFEYGPPAQVTIKDDDAPVPVPTVAPAPAPTAAPAPAPTPTPTASPTPTPTATPSPTLTPSPSPTFTPIAVEEGDEGFPWLPVGAVLGFLGAGAGALILTRMRRGV